MVISHSYVSLPEGIWMIIENMNQTKQLEKKWTDLVMSFADAGWAISFPASNNLMENSLVSARWNSVAWFLD